MSETVEGIYRPSTAVIVCSKLILSLLPFAQIAFGAVYHNDCPQQPYIPIYLEVMGAFSLLSLGLSFLPSVHTFKPSVMAFSFLTLLFYLCWFISGNVWIYSIYKPNYNKTTTNVDPYCDKTLYLFAFWSTNVTYVQLALFFCCCCCCPRHLPHVLSP